VTLHRRRKRKQGSFEEFKNMPLGKKKVEFVKWLMKRGVPLWEARTICHRKFYHGDPFVE